MTGWIGEGGLRVALAACPGRDTIAGMLAADPSPPAEGPRLDEARALDIGVVDIVLGLLTLPLLFWFLMYAVSGAERLVATRAARLRVYAWLLAIEAVMAAAIVAWVVLG